MVLSLYQRRYHNGVKSGVEWASIQPDKPKQNSLIERFNRTFRQDVLDSYMFESLTELRKYSQA